MFSSHKCYCYWPAKVNPNTDGLRRAHFMDPGVKYRGQTWQWIIDCDYARHWSWSEQERVWVQMIHFVGNIYPWTQRFPFNKLYWFSALLHPRYLHSCSLSSSKCDLPPSLPLFIQMPSPYPTSIRASPPSPTLLISLLSLISPKRARRNQ